MGYLPCAGQNTAYLFLRMDDKHGFTRKTKDTLKCWVKFINKLMHDLSCEQSPYDEERRIACYVGIGSEHKHRAPTRREWIDMLLRCSIRIEIYCGPDRAMRLVYEAWPFHLYRNSKHIIASMPSAIRHRSEQCPVSHAVRLVP